MDCGFPNPHGKPTKSPLPVMLALPLNRIDPRRRSPCTRICWHSSWRLACLLLEQSSVNPHQHMPLPFPPRYSHFKYLPKPSTQTVARSLTLPVPLPFPTTMAQAGTLPGVVGAGSGTIWSSTGVTETILLLAQSEVLAHSGLLIRTTRRVTTLST